MDKNKPLPPVTRTAVWQPISDAARSGEFVLQVCKNCASVQYPPRELCKDCLEDNLQWQKVAAKGELISHTIVQASTNAFFRESGPRQIALIKMDNDPVLFAHMACAEALSGDRVSVLNRSDLSGEGVFIAIVDKAGEQAQLAELNSLLLK